jgi:hypothetical protein
MWRKAYESSGMLRCVLAAAGLYYALKRVQPAPAVYLRAEVRGKLDRDPPKDPKAVINFGNAGLGPMYIHEFKILSKGKEVESIGRILDLGSSVEVSSESTGMYKTLTVPKPFSAKAFIPIFTVRPNREEDGSFGSVLAKELLEKEVAVKVTFSASDDGVLNFLTKDTKLIPVISE